MLSTPYVKIDLDKLNHNIHAMQEWVTGNGQVLRPHIKTHRTVAIAKMQLAAGAIGITCSKLGEAEVMADAGIDNILVAYSLVGEDKMLRLEALMRKATVTVTCDNMVSAAQLSRVGERAGRQVPVLAEVLTHIKRGGVAPEKLVDFVRQLQALPGLYFKGIFAYSGINSTFTDEPLRRMSEEENELIPN